MHNIISTSQAIKKAKEKKLPENYLQNLSKDIVNNFVGGLMSPFDLITSGINLALPQENELNLPSSYIPEFDLEEEYKKHASDNLLPKVLTNIAAFTAPGGVTRGVVKGLNQGRKALKTTKNLKYAGKKLKENVKDSVISNSFTPNAVLGGIGAGTGVGLFEHTNDDVDNESVLGKLASALVGGMFGNTLASRYVGNKVINKIPKIDGKKVKFSELEKISHPIYKDIDNQLLNKTLNEGVPVTLDSLSSNRGVQKIASKYSKDPVYLNVLNNQKNKIIEKLNLDAEKGNLDQISKKITEIADAQKKEFDAKHAIEFDFKNAVKELPIEKQKVVITDLPNQLQDLIAKRFGVSDTTKLQMNKDPVVKKIIEEPLIEKLINPVEKSNSEKIMQSLGVKPNKVLTESYDALENSKSLIDQKLLAEQLTPIGINKKLVKDIKSAIDNQLANFESEVSGVPVEQIKKIRGEYANYLETIDPFLSNIKNNQKEALERKNLNYLLKELKEGRPITKEILQKNPDLVESALSYLIKNPQNQLEIDKLSKVVMDNNIPLNEKQKMIIDLFNDLKIKRSEYDLGFKEEIADKIADIVKGTANAPVNFLKKLFTKNPNTKISNNLDLLTNQRNLKIVNEIQPYLKELKNSMIGETIFQKAGNSLNDLPYAITKNIKRSIKSLPKSTKTIDAEDYLYDQNPQEQQQIDVDPWSTDYKEGWKKAKVFNPKIGQYVTLYLEPNIYNNNRDYYISNGIKFDE